jgi:hypothetical protein
MATWTSMGHAMRRRSGAPSNHHESVGKNMSKNHMTPEEVIASAEHANSARRYMGSAASNFNNVSGTPQVGKLIPKKSTQAGDPNGMGTKQNRTNIERAGASYRITAKMPPMMSPEAGPTMQSAKMVPSVSGRQAPNFYSGVDSTY